MAVVKIEVINEGKSGMFSRGIALSDALDRLGIAQSRPCGGNGTCGKCKVIANGETVLACRYKVCSDTRVEVTGGGISVIGLTDAVMPELNKEPLISEGYGMAVDIGTTTIAGYIYKFPECVCVKSCAVQNDQARFGADVISRIDYARRGGLDALRDMVLGQIRELSKGYEIKKYVVTGNTTMLHFLTGKDPAGIAAAPFTPASLFGAWYGDMYIPGCISAYVGADVTAAILASGMQKDSVSLLADIGTNGEMALWCDGRLVCCSTAAGPAFEGALISQGSLAVPGAINSVYIANGKVCYTTINDEPPSGICGSGLIDAVACMLSLDIIDQTGYLEHDFEIGGSGVTITADDIRQVQLAKSAICSGIETLLHECGIDSGDVDRFYISGGFGSYINKANAAYIGLIPARLVNRAVVIGNGAGAGAEMMLINKGCIARAEEICAAAGTVELTGNSYFTERYLENMYFNI